MKRKIRFWQIALAIPVAFGIAGWVIAGVLTRSAQARLNREVTGLRILGMPMAPEEMPPPPVAGQNAAGEYRLAIASYNRVGRTPPGITAAYMATNIADSPPYRKWIDSQSEALQWVEVAAKKPFCDFERDWNQGYDIQCPELAKMKTLAQMAVAKARYTSDAGDFPLAKHWLEVSLRVAKHTRESTYIGMGVSIACERFMLDELQREIGLHGSSGEFRKLARDVLAGLGDLPSLREALRGEALLAHLTLSEMDNGSLRLAAYRKKAGWKDPTAQEKLWMSAYELPGVKQDVHAKVLAPIRRAVEMMGTDPNDLKMVLAGSDELDLWQNFDGSVAGNVVRELYPAYAEPGQAILRDEIYRRLTRTGLELYEERAKVGAFPPKLNAANSWAIDPCTGKPFFYRPGATHFVLYSLGHNRRDDGGAAGRPGAKTASDDIEFRAPRP